MTDYLIGADLGRQHDPAAFAVLERSHNDAQDYFDVLGVYQLPLRTSYPEVIRFLAAMAAHPDLVGKVQVVVDATGVGLAVMDMVLDSPSGLAELAWFITITGGDRKFSQDGCHFKVPKKDLVGALQLVLQERRVRMDPGNEGATVLRKELYAFTMTRTFSGQITFEAESKRDHDDMVIALMLPVWLANRVPLGWTSNDRPLDWGNLPCKLADGNNWAGGQTALGSPVPSWRQL